MPANTWGFFWDAFVTKPHLAVGLLTLLYLTKKPQKYVAYQLQLYLIDKDDLKNLSLFNKRNKS